MSFSASVWYGEAVSRSVLRTMPGKRKGERQTGTALSGIQPPASDLPGGGPRIIRSDLGIKIPP